MRKRYHELEQERAGLFLSFSTLRRSSNLDPSSAISPPEDYFLDLPMSVLIIMLLYNFL